MKIRTAPALAAAALLFAGCDRPTMTDPLVTAVATPRFSASSSVPLPVPPTNLGALIPTMSIGALTPRTWAVIRVVGSIHVDKNPELTACNPARAPRTANAWAGPLGLAAYSGDLKVTVSRKYQYLGLPLGLDGDSSTTKTKFFFNPLATPDTIFVARSGLAGTEYNCPGTIGWYILNGSQAAIIEELPNPSVNPLETMVASGDTVQFIAKNPPPGINLGWFFLAGDSLAQPAGYAGSGSLCLKKTTCAVRVTKSGRMYLGMGNGVGGTVSYPGPIVWVGRTPTASLTLECTPTTVPAGASTSCIAGTSPAGQPIQVSEWFIAGTADTATTPICSTATTCVATLAESSSIYVRALVGGFEQTKSVPISVVPMQQNPLAVTVACNYTSLARAQNISCSASTNIDTIPVTHWTFAPDDLSSADSVHYSGPGPWAGAMALSGTVTAYAQSSTQTASDQVHVVVTSRGWNVALDLQGEIDANQWGAQWFDDPSTGRMDTTVVVPLGLNVYPDGSNGYYPQGAWLTDTIGTGPNKDYAYVASHTLAHNRRILINRYITSLAETEILYNGIWYNRYYGAAAMGADPTLLLNGVRDHESSLSATGPRSHHRGFQIASAPNSCGNLAARLEALVRRNGDELDLAAEAAKVNSEGHVFKEAVWHMIVHSHYVAAPVISREPTSSVPRLTGFSDPQRNTPQGVTIPTSC